MKRKREEKDWRKEKLEEKRWEKKKTKEEVMRERSEGREGAKREKKLLGEQCLNMSD